MITYTLRPTSDGLWSIVRMDAAMFDGLQLGPAIKLAREAARGEHCSRGEPTCVEMRGIDSMMTLANYRGATEQLATSHARILHG